MILTPDQEGAKSAILAAVARGDRYLLTGYAGSGKTTLMHVLAREWRARGIDVVMTAPTHKAVSVLSSKLRQSGVDDVECKTIHSLLSLRPKIEEDRQVFVRQKNAKRVTAQIVVIDECSMIGVDLFNQIRNHLRESFVLFVGDPAQLPPVNERESLSFSLSHRSHLGTIVRQAAGNPVLDAAHAVRGQQGGGVDWSWCAPVRAANQGVFVPNGQTDAWMHKAFTSPEFDADTDRFRYLAWTNDRVAQINRKVQRWRYGDLQTPFAPGERALVRAPLIVQDEIIINANEEVTVLSINKSQLKFKMEGCKIKEAIIPTWNIDLLKDDGMKISSMIPSCDKTFNSVLNSIKNEAFRNSHLWESFHDLKSSMASLQSIYAMTVHTSQGSTFTNVFVDIQDIKKRAKSNTLEMQQMLYVAITRPSNALMLVGV